MDITPLSVQTEDGLAIEARLARPDQPVALAVLCHPHPLYGGDMHNPVPATLFQRLPGAGIAAVRFNFRGTGSSQGSHGDGTAERLDLIAAIDAALAVCDAPLTLVGYSFGADVVLATAHAAITQRIVIAPPLGLFDDFVAATDSSPTTVLLPTADQMIPPDHTRSVLADWPHATIVELPGADHFVATAVDQIVRLTEGRILLASEGER